MMPRAAHAPGQVRIIAGKWRNTKLAVPSVAGLRPSSDRMRETLFNWLMPVVPGARVLDLFAGTGALGLEALSRGAASTLFVERDPALVAQLRATLGRLQGGEAGTVQGGDVSHWLAQPATQTFDLAFVDPPFADGVWSLVLPLLETRLADAAWLYVESPPGASDAMPGSDWQLHREMRTRDACGRLYRRVGQS